mmetsp:Transcript_1725/g.2480  ORF Transcript_1725/g.2480 Transcript_1725/m.2480 type:complete len:353 (+) Transcript_1725:90-1148(+)|eukprot:CAMPEP_0184869022 /NCGR_PEP_ID=MMETSP0580-20130426/32550_1 /TAXON_ID=1118495 /ORGANISM="Dactyliosolen fragilissimus" /LENGTH=352 /DNA_ID=CAMNT_0027370241 /DNA_START=72 /DNA_END=1130 /DNA_ORIENTATION=+
MSDSDSSMSFPKTGGIANSPKDSKDTSSDDDDAFYCNRKRRFGGSNNIVKKNVSRDSTSRASEVDSDIDSNSGIDSEYEDKNKNQRYTCFLSSPESSKKKNARESIGYKLSKFDRERRRNNKPLKTTSSLLESSDEEVVCVTDSVTKARASVELLSSDDDDDHSNGNFDDDSEVESMEINNGNNSNTANTNLEMEEMLKKSKEAKSGLLLAQHCAIDIDDAEEDNDDDDCEVMCISSSTPSSAVLQNSMHASICAPTTPMGPKISVKLRTQIRNGKGSSTKHSLNGTIMTLHIHTNQKMNELMERYKKAKGPPISMSTVTFLFDGESMNLDTTPEMHDMEDDEIVDVLVDLQ